jgi:AraC family transcriptional regulator
VEAAVLEICSSPGQRVLSSARLGWRMVQVQGYVDPAVVDPFTAEPSDDLLVVLVTKGSCVIESRKGRAAYRPGSVGVTPPGAATELRWRSTSDDKLESLHTHLSGALVTETAEAAGKAGLPDVLQLDDPFVRVACEALGRAAREGAPALYADSLAQALVAHLVFGVKTEAPAGDRAVRQITSYMSDHLHEDVSLDDLAGQANLSKFHLLRMFKQATGFTPHRYLVDLRMRKAADLLQDTRQSVLQVAIACGYRSPGQFAATFRRVYGMSPVVFRGNSGRGSRNSGGEIPGQGDGC